jgi:hypothetical protein
MSSKVYINEKCQRKHSLLPVMTREQKSRSSFICDYFSRRENVSVLKRTHSIEDVELYRSEEILWKFHANNKSKKSKSAELETTTRFYNAHTNVLSFQATHNRIQAKQEVYEKLKLDMEQRYDRVCPIQLNATQIDMWLGMEHKQERSPVIESYDIPLANLNDDSSHDDDESFFQGSDDDTEVTYLECGFQV